MLKPFQNKSFVTSLAIFCASAAFWAYQYHRVIDREAQQEANRISVSLARLSQHALKDKVRVCLEGHKQIGSGFWFESGRKISDFQAFTAAGTEEPPSNDEVVIVFQRRKRAEPSLWDLLAQPQPLKGVWYAPTELDNKQLLSSMAKYYPKLDASKVAFVKYDHDLPAVVWIAMLCFLAGSVLMIPISVISTWRTYHKNERWVKRIDEDRTETYRRHQRAMRLVTADQFSLTENGLPRRRVDETFDVDKPKESRLPMFWKYLVPIGGLSASIAAGCAVESVLASQSLVGANMQGFVTIITAASVNVALMWLTDKKLAGREEKVKQSRARYRAQGFHQYHDKILKELGFNEMGDFHLKGSTQDTLQLCRTIYLSRHGNVLVEVGIESLSPFFSIESATNNGKLLETHSLITTAQEKRDV